MNDNNKECDNIFGKAIPQLIHDIRNPLNIIIGFSSIIQIDETVNDEIRTYLKKIFQSGMFIEELLSNIDFYMMEKLDLEETKFNVFQETNNFLKLKNEIIAEKGIIINQISDKDKDIDIRFSLELFRRILDNLFLFSQKGFKSSKLKEIQIVYKKEDKNFIIFYSDSSEPVFIEGDYFSFEDVLKTKRGLGPQFIEKYVEDYNGEVYYKTSKNWHAVLEDNNLTSQLNHGFIIKLPIFKE
ncbi:MAG: hypothetical protein A2086_17035 [Spirochaetes bacterium GWD1_27_9]|nr:MAG: hypothetical protein A2Z98_15360 [Spirochaetes bacterium GWB1_27_13]OHD27376.1 MAG: hypothetical protein A2Y34_07635 [Spirochaetes bacterium GWC1_27_15]OHD33334.1 MAG: hypothetical protein A2086_17035 [Spirochaetes bacterium GWD1_27_9]